MSGRDRSGLAMLMLSIWMTVEPNWQIYRAPENEAQQESVENVTLQTQTETSQLGVASWSCTLEWLAVGEKLLSVKCNSWRWMLKLMWGWRWARVMDSQHSSYVLDVSIKSTLKIHLPRGFRDIHMELGFIILLVNAHQLRSMEKKKAVWC